MDEDFLVKQLPLETLFYTIPFHWWNVKFVEQQDMFNCLDFVLDFNLDFLNLDLLNHKIFLTT
jgi:hypothetical protein